MHRMITTRMQRILTGLTAAMLLLGFGFSARVLSERAAFAPVHRARTVVIDPGHGGEDGGAVAADGTEESNINLAVSMKLKELFLFCGVEPVMTREEDVSVYTEGAKTLREKKVSDIHNRVALINALDDAVVLSIHQNSLPGSPKTCGAMVFYNPVDGAEDYAAAIQNSLNIACNIGEKQMHPIAKNVYLMQHINKPAVLVECGFLSNSAETEALKTPETQLRIALAILCGYFYEKETP